MDDIFSKAANFFGPLNQKEVLILCGAYYASLFLGLFCSALLWKKAGKLLATGSNFEQIKNWKKLYIKYGIFFIFFVVVIEIIWFIQSPETMTDINFFSKYVGYKGDHWYLFDIAFPLSFGMNQVIPFIFIAIKVYSGMVCENCSKKFYYKNIWGNLLTKKCRHCGHVPTEQN